MAIRSINRALLEKCAETAAKSDDQLSINTENDISVARDGAMRMAQSCGFTLADSTSVATAVSELARNILHYAGSGRIVLSRVAENGRRGMKVVALDSGPGIANLDEIMSGTYTSRTGMGLGLLGTKRLMDRFNVESNSVSGTRVTAVKYGR